MEVTVHRNYVILIPDLENHVFPMLALIRPSLGQSGLKVWLFGQTFQLTLETRLIERNYAKKLSILRLPLESHVFPMFVPYSDLIRPSLVQLGLKFGFWSNFLIKIKNKIN